MIYVSTGWIKNLPAWKTSEELLNSGINFIELSGGSYDENQLNNLKELKKYQNFIVHNYFPPPKDPFVLNLSSLCDDISNRTLNHIEIAMQYSVELDSPQYSFHGGFLIDPKITELGKTIENKKLYDRKEALKVFIDRLNTVSERAKKLGVSLLIENNVLSKKNLYEFKSNPFLMVDKDECNYVMRQTPNNIGLLLDFGHLKVSSKTMCFNPVKFLHECNEWICGYHLSDNNGSEDSNNKVTENSWFWSYLKTNLNYYSLEVSDISNGDFLEQTILSKKFIEKKYE